jgi:hypothetical protein
MNRRDYLAGLTLGLSSGLGGCQGIRGAEGKSDTRTVTIVDQDSVTAVPSFEITVEVLEETVNTDHTARLRVTKHNQGDTRRVSLGATGNCLTLFDRSEGGSDDPAGLWLHFPWESEEIEKTGTRWVQDKPKDEPREFPSDACIADIFEGGASQSHEYLLWHDYRKDGYLNPGRYRWQTRGRVYESESLDGESTTFEWGFSLEIESR